MDKRILIAIFVVLVISVNANGSTLEVNFFDVFEQNGSIMLLLDAATGDIEHANQAAAQFYGYTIEELKGMNVSAINLMPFAERIAKMEEATRQQLSSFLMEHQLANGEIRKVQIFSSPYTLEDRTFLFSIIVDVTENWLAEESNQRNVRFFIYSAIVAIAFLLLLSYLFYHSFRKVKSQNAEIEDFNFLRQTFIDADSNYVWLKDEELRYLFVNRAVKDFHGKDYAEIIGATDYSLVDAETCRARPESFSK